MTNQNNAAQAAILRRLNQIHADAGYLFGRAAADGACAGAMAESVRIKIDEVKTLLSKLRAPVADSFESWWSAQAAANGGNDIGADYRHWANKAWLASAPVADEDDQPTAPNDDAIAECWVSASDIDGIAYDGPSFERGYRAALASAPVPVLKDWRIDTSAGGPILVYKDCSVIESAQAEYVLRLIAADQASAPVAGEAQPVIHQHGFASDNQKLRAINESLDKQLEQLVTERDEYHDMADKLANAIADHLLIEIGEHSSSNCPWMRALEAIENAAPQASAEYERGQADGWAAGWDQAIKQPQADKEDGTHG